MGDYLVCPGYNEIWETQTCADNPRAVSNSFVRLVHVFIEVDADIALPADADDHVLVEDLTVTQNDCRHDGHHSPTDDGVAVVVKNVETLQFCSENDVA